MPLSSDPWTALRFLTTESPSQRSLFTRAGFRVVDCPSLTQLGKSRRPPSTLTMATDPMPQWPQQRRGVGRGLELLPAKLP